MNLKQLEKTMLLLFAGRAIRQLQKSDNAIERGVANVLAPAAEQMMSEHVQEILPVLGVIPGLTDVVTSQATGLAPASAEVAATIDPSASLGVQFKTGVEATLADQAMQAMAEAEGAQ